MVRYTEPGVLRLCRHTAVQELPYDTRGFNVRSMLTNTSLVQHMTLKHGRKQDVAAETETFGFLLETDTIIIPALK